MTPNTAVSTKIRLWPERLLSCPVDSSCKVSICWVVTTFRLLSITEAWCLLSSVDLLRRSDYWFHDYRLLFHQDGQSPWGELCEILAGFLICLKTSSQPTFYKACGWFRRLYSYHQNTSLQPNSEWASMINQLSAVNVHAWAKIPYCAWVYTCNLYFISSIQLKIGLIDARVWIRTIEWKGVWAREAWILTTLIQGCKVKNILAFVSKEKLQARMTAE